MIPDASTTTAVPRRLGRSWIEATDAGASDGPRAGRELADAGSTVDQDEPRPGTTGHDAPSDKIA